MSDPSFPGLRVLVLAGHALYHAGQWFGLPSALDPSGVEQQVRDAFLLARSGVYDVLVLSGGRTRPDLPEVRSGYVTCSEAEGMLVFARDQGLDAGKAIVLLEPFARDSFENVFFSACACHAASGAWPSHMGVVSCIFKAVRFYLIAAGMGLDGRFAFHGCGAPRSLLACISEVCNLSGIVRTADGSGDLGDPLQRSPAFAAKRAKRTPPDLAADYLTAVKRSYDHPLVPRQAGAVAAWIDRLEHLHPGEWRDLTWPWLSGGDR